MVTLYFCRISKLASTFRGLAQRLGGDGFHFALRRAAKTTGMELEWWKDMGKAEMEELL